MSFNTDLLTAVNELLTEFISGNRVDKQLFDRLLSALLKFTDSEYGFIGHVEGRGLGLYLVNNQVEAMGGSISIESKPREGSSFCIRIPKML